MTNITMRSLLASLGATLLATACATTGHYSTMVAQWKGQPVERLVTQWGPPDKSIKLESGDEVYEYVDRMGKMGGVVDRNITLNLTCNTTFTVHSGTVSGVTFRGNSCVSQ